MAEQVNVDGQQWRWRGGASAVFCGNGGISLDGEGIEEAQL